MKIKGNINRGNFWEVAPRNGQARGTNGASLRDNVCNMDGADGSLTCQNMQRKTCMEICKSGWPLGIGLENRVLNMRQRSHQKIEDGKLNLEVWGVSQIDFRWLWLATDGSSHSAMVHREKLDRMEAYAYGSSSMYTCDSCGDTQIDVTMGNGPRNQQGGGQSKAHFSTREHYAIKEIRRGLNLQGRSRNLTVC